MLKNQPRRPHTTGGGSSVSFATAMKTLNPSVRQPQPQPSMLYSGPRSRITLRTTKPPPPLENGAGDGGVERMTYKSLIASTVNPHPLPPAPRPILPIPIVAGNREREVHPFSRPQQQQQHLVNNFFADNNSNTSNTSTSVTAPIHRPHTTSSSSSLFSKNEHPGFLHEVRRESVRQLRKEQLLKQQTEMFSVEVDVMKQQLQAAKNKVRALENDLQLVEKELFDERDELNHMQDELSQLRAVEDVLNVKLEKLRLMRLGGEKGNENGAHQQPVPLVPVVKDSEVLRGIRQAQMYIQSKTSYVNCFS
eukprot:PhF_6_TR30595/c0_g1_i3/m.45029